MNIAQSIMKIYPDLTPFVDFRCVCEEDVQSIAEWNTDKPKPTDQQLNDAWLEICKDEKKAQLDLAFDVALVSGFKSSALGVEHTYPADFQAMVFFGATMNRINNDPSFTSTKQKTLDSGYLDHTAVQFIQAFNDGHQNGENLIAHLNELKADVDKVTSPDQLDGIQW